MPGSSMFWRAYDEEGAVALALLDRYLLGEPIAKAELVRSLLAEPSPQPAAAPFYRALAAVGPRAAEEAFMALRLAVRGEVPTDEGVRELKDLLARARSGNELEREAARLAYRARLGIGTPS